MCFLGGWQEDILSFTIPPLAWSPPKSLCKALIGAFVALPICSMILLLLLLLLFAVLGSEPGLSQMCYVNALALSYSPNLGFKAPLHLLAMNTLSDI